MDIITQNETTKYRFAIKPLCAVIGTLLFGNVNAVQAKLDRLVNGYLEGLIDRGTYQRKKDELIRQKIGIEGQQAGFLANLEEPFSPDGYYTEGPYYQRYAMYPFLVFAQGLHNAKPELEIFQYKDGVLLKAVDALLALSDADGEFFPLNDGQKGMSYLSRELVTAVNIAYHVGGNDPRLLSIAERQGRGYVVMYVEDPNFRLFWSGLTRLFLNSIYFLPSLGGE